MCASKTGAFPNLPAKRRFGGLNQYRKTASTRPLCVCLRGLHARVQTLLLSSRPCRFHGCRLCDPCSLLCFHGISACAQFGEQTAVYCSAGDRVKISNRLGPRRDYSANITVIHQKSARRAESWLHFLFFIKHFQSSGVKTE